MRTGRMPGEFRRRKGLHKNDGQVELKTKASCLEKQIEKKVCDYAKQQGCLVFKFTSPNNRSVPDRIIIAPGGKVGFLELKRPGNKPTPLQADTLRKLKEQGCHAEWTDSVEGGKQFVDKLPSKP